MYRSSLYLTAILCNTAALQIVAMTVVKLIFNGMVRHLNLIFRTPNALSMVFRALECDILYLTSLWPTGFATGVRRNGSSG